MPAIRHVDKRVKLPRRFEALVRKMPPHAIMDEVAYETTLEMVDRLMANASLTEGQSLYLETLVQLVQVYEATHHRVDGSNVRGLASLKHLLSENQMNASDLARLLGVHPSMGSKILKGERALTVDHLKRLSARFSISPAVFID